ncbi:nuclear transport factor 2 family protein [Pseudoclavibacter helvolus]|uniref:nuclear transport factor 2 family protein n=1 Tax=Pseudoclavibacter helvolus TaxID=255205 RepID=UPI003C720E0A
MTALHIPEPVVSFIAAINGQDEIAFRRAWSRHAFVDDWGTRYEGIDAIVAWSDRELLGASGTFTPERAHHDAETITVVGDWRSSFANGFSLFRFVVDGDKIASMTIREG